MIIVCSLADLKNVCNSVNPSHLISVIDPGYEPETPKNVSNHLKLGFDDIIQLSNQNLIHRNSAFTNLLSTNDQILPNENHIIKIVEFINTWDQKKPIVIHCWCGVSRSMATATYLICKLNNKNISKNVSYIRSIAPHANPNSLMISLFEKQLKIDKQINEAFTSEPPTKTYDCSTNFAPVTIFDIKDIYKII